MIADPSWNEMSEALEFAVSCIDGDPEPMNDRERADGDLYVMRMLAAVIESSTLTLDPDRPSFLPMLESVRFVGGAGPDINNGLRAHDAECCFNSKPVGESVATAPKGFSGSWESRERRS